MMDPKDFTTEEWYTVLEGTGAATGLIVVSDMSGPIGLTKEATAALDVMREGRWQTPFMTAFRSEVLAATKERQEEFKKIADARNEMLKEQRPSKEQAHQMGLEAIRNAVSLVESKAGAEAGAEFRQLVWEVAQRTAQAGKEGGFLGIGGTPVSEGEQAALDQIRTTLGM
jgi:hypothetical protein